MPAKRFFVFLVILIQFNQPIFGDVIEDSGGIHPSCEITGVDEWTEERRKKECFIWTHDHPSCIGCCDGYVLKDGFCVKQNCKSLCKQGECVIKSSNHFERCICTVGFGGKWCDDLCPPGHFGRQCEHNCEW